MSKTIKLSIIYGVLLVLVAVLVMGFCIKKSYNPEISAPHAIIITSSNGQAQYDGGDVQNTKERYDVLYGMFEKATTESFIASLFSGNMSYASRIESAQTPEFTGYRMMFSYADEQTVVLNGQEYAHGTGSQTILKFQKVYFDVVETNGFAKVAMYYEVPTVVNETNKTEYYKRLVIADFDELYKAIVDAQ